MPPRVPAQEREGADRGVVVLDPLEGGGVLVPLVQRGQRPVARVEVAQPRGDARVLGPGEVGPVEAVLVVPLALGRELGAHEEQLPSRLRVLHAEQQPEVGELLPPVARHLGEQRSLAVHDLVVRERQDEVLRPRVHRPERDLAVVVTAVDRVAFEVLQRVVHPAHVPLRAEAEAARVHRARHAGEGRGLLGEGLHVRVRAVHLGVELAEELDRVEVLVAAVHVGRPLAGPARVVEVEHRRDARPRGCRRRGSGPASAARCSRGTSAPRGARSRTAGCSSRDAGPGARTRRAGCRRSGRARTRRWGSARAPSRG